MSETPPSQKDIELASKVFDDAIRYFNIPDEPAIETAPEFLHEDGTIDFSKVPLVTIRNWGNGLKFLNLAYFFSGFLTVSADYNPTIAILEFLNDARNLLKTRFPQWSEDRIEKQAEHETLKMTLLLFSRLYPRMNLAMQNLVSEVISIWYKDWLKWEAQVCSESGIKPASVSDTKMLRGLLKDYENDVLKLWLDVPDRSLEEKKIQLAKEYPSILGHWQKLYNWCRKVDVDWREYAKAGKFLDTPDDLLNKLEDSSFEKISHLAIEHSARRVGLLKFTQDNTVLEKRAKDIKVTGYTPRQLFDFLSEGKVLLGEVQKKQPLHPESRSDESHGD